jgi:hypothetical protein
MNGLPTGMDRAALAASTEYIGGKALDNAETSNIEVSWPFWVRVMLCLKMALHM